MKIKILIPIALFLICLLLLVNNLDKPFYGEHDWNGVRYGNIARNYLRYSIKDTKLGQIENSGLVNHQDFEYFTHYPPVLSLLISVSYIFFGISELSTRLVPLLASAGTVVLIYLIGSKLWNVQVGIIAGMLALATPLLRYFGKTPVHEPLVVFFVTLAFWFYIKFRTSGKVVDQLFFIFSLILAQFTTWAGFFLVPALTLVAIFKKNWQEIRLLIPYWFLSLALFTIHLLHTKYLTGSFLGGDLVGVFLQRATLSESGQLSQLNFLSYLNQLRLWLSTLYTVILVTLAILGLMKNLRNRWLIALGIFGSIYLIIFPNSSFIHNYLVYYLLPFLALSAALGISFITNLFFLKKISFVIMLFIIAGVFLERQNFIDALNRSNANQFDVEVGKFINSHTEKNQTILVSPKEYSYAADKFLRFYSDRELIYDSCCKSYQVKISVETNKFTLEHE